MNSKFMLRASAIVTRNFTDQFRSCFLYNAISIERFSYNAVSLNGYPGIPVSSKKSFVVGGGKSGGDGKVGFSCSRPYEKLGHHAK